MNELARLFQKTCRVADVDIHVGNTFLVSRGLDRTDEIVRSFGIKRAEHFAILTKYSDYL